MKHLLDEQPPHKLKYCLNVEFGFGDYEEKIREVVGQTEGDEGKRYDDIPNEIFHPYAATDAEGTFSLLQLYFDRMSKKPHLMKLYQEESEPALHNIADMEWVGAKMNMEVVNKLGKEYSSELDRLTDKCRELSNPKFNPGSPAQVAELLRSMGLGHHITAPDTASGYSTNKNTLLPLAKDYPIVDHILKRRALSKLKGTYIDNVHKDVDSDGRLRYQFNLFGTTSGRQSNRFYHQIHRIDEDRIKRGMYVMRDMVGEEEDFYFYYADYSQIEYRVFAVVTDDQDLIELFNRGGNIHIATAADLLDIAEEDVSSFNKTNLGKGFNFGIMFGSKGYQLAEVTYEDPITGDELPMNLTKVQKFVARYLEKHPKIKEYQELVPDIARAQGCTIRSVFGRERRVPELTDENKWTREHAEREIINFTIQSPAAGVPTRTGSKVREWLRSDGVWLDEVRQVTTVHDSLGYGVRKHLIEWFDVGFRKIAERPIPELNNMCFPVNRGWHDFSWARAELGAA
jgi:DNA polymerase-1